MMNNKGPVFGDGQFRHVVVHNSDFSVVHLDANGVMITDALMDRVNVFHSIVAKHGQDGVTRIVRSVHVSDFDRCVVEEQCDDVVLDVVALMVIAHVFFQHADESEHRLSDNRFLSDWLHVVLNRLHVVLNWLHVVFNRLHVVLFDRHCVLHRSEIPNAVMWILKVFAGLVVGYVRPFRVLVDRPEVRRRKAMEAFTVDVANVFGSDHLAHELHLLN